MRVSLSFGALLPIMLSAGTSLIDLTPRRLKSLGVHCMGDYRMAEIALDGGSENEVVCCYSMGDWLMIGIEIPIA